ncbi:MAG: DUF4160 domain-containing protein [Cyclobacteriaceae bacterium]|nr:DUF4160 domain-containing protein [Cyclobacteriaceae bacterium]
MGKVLILANYIFLIYGTDIYEKRKHIHVTYAHRGYKRACKFWLDPEITLDTNKKGDFSESEFNEIKKLIIEHKELLINQLELFYSNQPVKAIRK